MNREYFWQRYGEYIDIPPAWSESKCWTWTGTKNTNGYGLIYLDKKMRLAHRVVHETFNEELEPGLWVLHSCNNTSCVNPIHLRQGAPAENYNDMLRDYDVRADVVHYMRSAYR